MPWDPSQLSGLKLWLEGDIGLNHSGANVTSWDDQSGQGNHLNVVSTTAPTYLSNAWNGRPGVRFVTASSTWLSRNVNIIGGTFAYLFAFVMKPTSTPPDGTEQIVIGNFATAGGVRFFESQFSGSIGHGIDYQPGGGGGDFTAGTERSTFSVYFFGNPHYNLNPVGDGSNYFYINGADQITSNNGDAGGGDPGASAMMTLGASLNGPPVSFVDQFWDGDMIACIVCSAMNINQWPQLYDYWRLKWFETRITTHPQPQTVVLGAPATFSVVADSTGGTLTYAWQKNGTPIGGATSASYTTPDTVIADNLAIFECVVTNSNGTATSAAAALYVNPPAQANVFGTTNGLKTKVGAFNSGTGAAATTVSVTNVGFLPKFVLFWLSGRTETTDTIGRANHQRGFGVAISPTARHAIASQSQDAQATSNCDQADIETRCVITIDTATGATNGAFDLQSMDADGFTLVVSTQFASSVRIHYLAIGGDDFVAATRGLFTETLAAAGTISYASMGGRPDAVIIMSMSAGGTPPLNSTSSRVSIGFAAGPGPDNAVWTGGSSNGAATMQSVAYCRSGESLAILDASVATPNSRGLVAGFGVDGISVTWNEVASTGRTYLWCALFGGKYHVGSVLTQTDTVTNITATGCGFTPKGALFLSAGRAQDAADTATDHDRWSMGAFDSALNQGAHATLDEDAVADSEVTTAVEHDNVYINISLTSTIDGLMRVTSTNSDGFVGLMSDADPSQAFVAYLAMGSNSG